MNKVKEENIMNRKKLGSDTSKLDLLCKIAVYKK